MSQLDLTDREIERVLAGHQPPGRPDLAEVAFFFARLRTMEDFEQAPPMSPRLLAELDASEVERRDRRDDRPRHRPAHARRSNVARRRWQLIGAAAVVAILGGLLVLSSQDAGDGQRTEVAERTEPESEDDGSSRTRTTKPVTTVATTVPTTTAPPPTEPVTTTTAAPATTDAPEQQVPQDIEPSMPPLPQDQPGQDGGGSDWDNLDEFCENPPSGGYDGRSWDEWCEVLQDGRDDHRRDGSP
jgi:hypothetical protein